MDYPLFLVPHIGGGWLIGGIAIFHVIIAHFAIGGGLLMVATEQFAARRNDALWLAFARKHSVFLVLLSAVLGALSGVGIWFTVGLVHPAATASLIHTFVWGWAIEWVFFIVEIAAALLYVGTWDRVSRRTHLAIGWIYFVAAYLSLVVINGIVTFMLTPGRWLRDARLLGRLLQSHLLALAGPPHRHRPDAGGRLWLAGGDPTSQERRARGAGPVPVRLGDRVGSPSPGLGFVWWAENLPAEARDLIFPADGVAAPDLCHGARGPRRCWRFCWLASVSWRRAPSGSRRRILASC